MTPYVDSYYCSLMILLPYTFIVWGFLALHWYLSTLPHGIIAQKRVNFIFKALRISYIRRYFSALSVNVGIETLTCFLMLQYPLNTLRTGDADLRFYITTVQDGWRKSAFLTRACFPCTMHLIMQYIEPVSEWSCWRMFIETWPHSELTFRHSASCI